MSNFVIQNPNGWLEHYNDGAINEMIIYIPYHSRFSVLQTESTEGRIVSSLPLDYDISSEMIDFHVHCHEGNIA